MKQENTELEATKKSLLDPSWAWALGLFVLFGLLQFGILRLLNIDYTTIANNADNALRAIVLRVGITATVFTVIAFALRRHWGSVWDQSDYKLKKEKWVKFIWAIPAIMIVASVMRIVLNEWGVYGSDYIIYMIVGTLFIGIAEETTFRGLAIRALRGSTNNETRVMLWSSVLFGLIHGINIINGAALGATIIQVALTILFGIAMYLALRLTGRLWLPIFLHAIWDFSILTIPEDVVTHAPYTLMAQVILYSITIIAAIILVRKSTIKSSS